jgi:hypothetical protein
VIGAQVEIVGGPARLAASTDWYGSYSLDDVPSDAAIRVSKDGYAPAVVSVRERTILTPALSVLDVSLVWTGPPGRDVTGSYTLTVSANCSATSDLPAALRTQQYNATVARRTETEVEVRLSGADFAIEPGSGKGDRFFGRILAEGVLFTLEAVYDWGPHPSVLEQVPDGWLEISGRVLAHHTETGLSGTLNGSFMYYPDGSACYIYEWCPSESHLFVLSH